MNILSYQLMIADVNTQAAMKAHQARVARLIRQACENQEAIDLVVLPELSALEYSIQAFDNLAELATGLDGWLVESMSTLAQELETALCFGMPRCDNNHFYVSQIVINCDGAVIGCYDKVHLAQFGDSNESPYFSPGTHVTTFELGGFRFGIALCYDMRFGEYISGMVQKHQLDAIVHPVAFSQDGSFASWKSFACTRALEHQVYWLSVNRAGSLQGQSLFCPPWFESEQALIRLDETECFQIITLEHEKLHRAREKYPLLQDRLNDYSGIVGSSP